MKIVLSIPGSDGMPIRLEPPSGVPTGGLSTDTGQNVISVALELLLLGALVLTVSSIIRGGINIITSGGDKEKFQRGRERARYAIIGLIVVFMSFFILNLIGSFFGINLLQISK